MRKLTFAISWGRSIVCNFLFSETKKRMSSKNNDGKSSPIIGEQNNAEGKQNDNNNSETKDKSQQEVDSSKRTDQNNMYLLKVKSEYICETRPSSLPKRRIRYQVQRVCRNDHFIISNDAITILRFSPHICVQIYDS